MIWETIWRILKKLKIKLPCDPAVPLLGIYPKKSKTLIQKGLCTPVFTAASVTTAKVWKQPKCPSINEWTKKTWHMQTTEYYSTINNNEILPPATTWMDLEGILLSAVSPRHNRMISLICEPKKK